MNYSFLFVFAVVAVILGAFAWWSAAREAEQGHEADDDSVEASSTALAPVPTRYPVRLPANVLPHGTYKITRTRGEVTVHITGDVNVRINMSRIVETFSDRAEELFPVNSIIREAKDTKELELVKVLADLRMRGEPAKA